MVYKGICPFYHCYYDTNMLKHSNILKGSFVFVNNRLSISSIVKDSIKIHLRFNKDSFKDLDPTSQPS